MGSAARPPQTAPREPTARAEQRISELEQALLASALQQQDLARRNLVLDIELASVRQQLRGSQLMAAAMQTYSTDGGPIRS